MRTVEPRWCHQNSTFYHGLSDINDVPLPINDVPLPVSISLKSFYSEAHTLQSLALALLDVIFFLVLHDLDLAVDPAKPKIIGFLDFVVEVMFVI